MNVEEPTESESTGIFQMGSMLMNNIPVVKPGQRKFQKDSQGYSKPQITFEGNSASQHVPTPIPSSLTFREDAQMNSRENTFGDNSATLPIMDNESENDGSSSSGTGGTSRL